MWAVLLPMLIQLAIKLGMAWLAHKFPWLSNEQKAVIQAHLDEVKMSKQKACDGIGCPVETKGLG